MKNEKGNAVVIVLVALVVIAVGALAYLSGQMAGEKVQDNPAMATAGVQADATGAQSDQGIIEVKPGNPVVAKVGSDEITRTDTFNFIQSMPANVRQQVPVDQLFRLAQNQIINARVISNRTSGVNLDGDPEVKRLVEEAKKEIVRNVFVQKEVTRNVTDERMQQAYELYKQNFPETEEVKARHILVAEEGQAKDIIAQLSEGASFEELAQENSTDGTAEKGGDLGYFAKSDVVAPFADAAFVQDVGTVSEKPIKTDFGYHVVKVEDKRIRPVPELDQVRPLLEVELRRAVLDDLVRQWRAEATIEVYDINGDAIEETAAN